MIFNAHISVWLLQVLLLLLLVVFSPNQELKTVELYTVELPSMGLINSRLLVYLFTSCSPGRFKHNKNNPFTF